MGPNIEDNSIIDAEKDASPDQFNRFASTNANQSFDQNYPPNERSSRTEAGEEIEQPEEIDHTATRIDSYGNELRTNKLGRTQTETERINTDERHPTALERIETHRSQHSNTVGGRVTSRRKPERPNFGAGKPYPPDLPDKEEYVVEFDGHDDPLHPQNWSMGKKLGIAAVLAFNSLCATFGSSVFSNASQYASREFIGTAGEVATLMTSLYVLGYAFGPIIWAPLSELYGRKLPILIGTFGFGVFSIGVAVAKDIQTVQICRFFSGLFGSCPLAVVAAVFSDMFNNKQRGISIAVFAATVFMGPELAPFIGGFITTSYLGWRWTEYLTAIMAFTALILAFFIQKETYPPVILVQKASQLRRETKNWGIHAKQEEVEVDFIELLTKNVSRPLRILFTEPIVLLVTIYMSFIYGILYLNLTAYALVFQGKYGFSPGVAGLPYFGILAGIMIGFIAIVLEQPSYVKKLMGNENIPVPEWRLPLPMFAAVIFTGGLFWFGWTGYQGTIPWIVPTLSGLFTGFGIYTIFVQFLNYIVDAYLMFAASAIAGNTFMRSIFGAAFPLFATYMYEGIGIQWGNTFLGCLAAVMIPMPVLFFLYGHRIRERSKMAPALDLKMGPSSRRRKGKDIETGSSENESPDGTDEKKE